MKRSVFTMLAVPLLFAAMASSAGAQVHNESGDARQSMATAQVAAENPLTGVAGNVAGNTADLCRVCASGGAWSARTRSDGDPMLWLFDAEGRTVAFNDDLDGLQSFMSGSVVAGTYYLGVSHFPYGYGYHHADERPSPGDPGYYEWYDGYNLAYTVDLSGFGGSDCPEFVRDADGDGVKDADDNCPNVANADQVEYDTDAQGDACDSDDDGDGVADVDDAFPLDSEESVDTDGDGIGNNADCDDDGDGVADNEDALPLDSEESVDTDGDGIGDNADDDGDGVADTEDAFPLDKEESVDTDGDGTGNDADCDDDGDGVTDDKDSSPLDAANARPAGRDVCRSDGYKAFLVNGVRFKTHGDCVSYVATGGTNLPKS